MARPKPTLLTTAFTVMLLHAHGVHALQVLIPRPSHVVLIGERVSLQADATDMPTGTAYSWDFGDGARAAGLPISHTWSQVGVFVITLTATQPTGQVRKVYEYVNVLPGIPKERTYEDAWQLIRQRIIGTADWLEQSQAHPYYRFPLRNLSYEEGIFSPRWELRLGWTGGFWVGSLWRLYMRSGDPEDLGRAKAWNRGILGEERVGDHDRGFVYYNSSALGYELTGDSVYLESVVKAANQLVWMFDMAGTGLIPIYTSSNITIIDTMMNLQILWWYNKRIGDNPHLYEIAVAHADKTRRHFIRPDGSTWQSIHFNKVTGEPERWETRQGLDNTDTSTWSRGQAWAIYGFSEAWRATKEPEFLSAAERVSDFYLGHQPDDHVPWFDFSPRIFDNPNAHLKDSSAAAIAAAGLLNLAETHPDTDKKRFYLQEARSIVNALILNYLAPFGDEDVSVPGMLLHGCYYWGRAERRDSELIWGTYYLLDALQRLLTLPAITNAAVRNLVTDDDQVVLDEPFQIEAQVTAHRLAYSEVVADLSGIGGSSRAQPTSFDPNTGKAVWTGLVLHTSPPGSIPVVLQVTDGLGRTAQYTLEIHVSASIQEWADHQP